MERPGEPVPPAGPTADLYVFLPHSPKGARVVQGWVVQTWLVILVWVQAVGKEIKVSFLRLLKCF